MAEADILEKIADIKKDISTVNATLNTHVKPGNNLTNSEFDKGKKEIVDAVKKGKDEQKNAWESFAEAIGLKDIFEAFQQLNPISMTLLAVAAGLTFINERFLKLGTILNNLHERVTGKLWTITDRGIPGRRTRAQVDAAQSVSINPHNLSEETLNGLKTALNGLAPEIVAFNSAARNMKSPRTLTQIATALGKIKDAISPNPADDIRDVARAVDALNGKLRNYDPDRLPKPRTLRDVAGATRDLSSATQTLGDRFRSLASDANAAAGAVGQS